MDTNKIKYGIDLGTTNSAIARIEHGEPRIIKSDTQQDIMPSCVAINKKKAILVGHDALHTLTSDRKRSVKNWKNSDSNCYIEFKRTMGTDKEYKSSILNKIFYSEDLSAEVLKRLNSFVKDDEVNTSVITVPARFTINQKDATKRAADLAGFRYSELLQEPIAASFAYGMDSKKKGGIWVVFDFGGGTFDAALVNVEDGVMRVADMVGDNHLGGKNIDEEIVERLLLPIISEKYSIDSILTNENKRSIFYTALKHYAEKLKIQLSFQNEYNIISDIGEPLDTDDEGNDFEIDITVNEKELSKVVEPIYQRAIDLTIELLERNNITGDDLDSLILVGGPTYSPILRKMLEEQICKPDTSVDPMTVVARGAALYASTIEIPNEIRTYSKDPKKVQLDVKYESTTVEKETYVTICVDSENKHGDTPRSLFTELIRTDEAWSSGKKEIDEMGELFEVLLNEGKSNEFIIKLYDETGSELKCEPCKINIIQGSSIASAILPYNIGIEIKSTKVGKPIFKTVKGFEMNNSLPATGVENNLKTQKAIRPGNKEDFIKIPIYLGDKNAEGTRAMYNDHIYDVKITGENIPTLLTENSSVDITLHTDKSGRIINAKAYFPTIDHTVSVDIPSDTVQKEIEDEWIDDEMNKAINELDNIRYAGHYTDESELNKIEKEISALQERYNQNRTDYERKAEIRDNLRKIFQKYDKINEESDWPRMENALRNEFDKLDKANKEFGTSDTDIQVKDFKNRMDEIIHQKDIKMAKLLKDEINQLWLSITFVYHLIAFLDHHHQNFDSYHWSDPTRARQLLSHGQKMIAENPSVQVLHPIVRELIGMLPKNERPEDHLLRE